MGIDDFGNFVLSADFSGGVMPPGACAFPAIRALDHEPFRAKGSGFVPILYRHKDNALGVDAHKKEFVPRGGCAVRF